MTLLFEDVSLRLPLPDKELTLHFRGQGNPFSIRIYGHAINFLLRDLETMNALKRIKIIQRKYSIRLSNTHHGRLILSHYITTSYPRLRLQIKLLLLLQQKPSFGNLVLKFGHTLLVLFLDLILIWLLPSLKPLLLFELLEFHLFLALFGPIISPLPE